MLDNPLSAGSLATTMAASLPRKEPPALKSPYDAIALSTHACMVGVGFTLIGLGEDHRIAARSEASNPEPLPEEWNASSSYAFRYSHPQSSMEYLIKVNRLGPKAVILGLGLGDDKTASFDVAAKDFTSESAFPFSATSTENESAATDITATSQGIIRTFISDGRLSDFGSLFKISIIQKLIRNLYKEGYEESAAETTQPRESGPSASRPTIRDDPLRDDRRPYPPAAQPHPFDDPLLVRPPRRPVPAGDFPPPDFEDEYEINRPPRNLYPGEGGYGAGGRNPLSIGHDDLYPQGLGPNDPLRGTLGPAGLPRPGGSGGMHPTFDDPMFGGGGVGGYDPRHPPGARYDPVGPGDGPRGAQGGPRFPGGRGGGGSFGGRGAGPPNPFGGYGGGDFI